MASSTSSTTDFWSYVKKISGKVKGSTISDLVSPSDGQAATTSFPNGQAATATTDAEKAVLLNNFFVEQTRLQNIPSTFPDLTACYPDSAVADSIQTSPSEVFDCLQHLKPRKAPG